MLPEQLAQRRYLELVRLQEDLIKSAIDSLGITVAQATPRLELIYTQDIHNSGYKLTIVDKTTSEVLASQYINWRMFE